MELFEQNLITELTWNDIFNSGTAPTSPFENDVSVRESIIEPNVVGGVLTGASYKSTTSGARVEIFPKTDPTIGFVSYATNGNIAFKTIVSGTDQGDVILGNYAGGQGILWDQSAGAFNIKGVVTATSGVIGGWTIDVSSLSAVSGGNTTILSSGATSFSAGPTGAPTVTITQTGVLNATGVTISGALTAGVGSSIAGAYITSLGVDKLTAGTISSKAITLGITAGTGDSYINAGKTDFTNTDAGFILGLDDSDSDKAKFYIGDATYYLNWTGSALNVNGAVIDGTTTANGVAVAIIQPRAETLYKQFVFIGSRVDGLTETVQGTLTRTTMETYLRAGTIAVRTTALQSVAYEVGGGGSGGFYRDLEMIIFAKLASAVNQNVFLGLEDGGFTTTVPANATATADHIGFFIDDATLYASNANGTTQTKTSIAGITLTNYNTYRFVLDVGVDIKFYVNDVLKATHTTNLPTADNAPKIFLGIASTNTDDTANMWVSNNYSILYPN